VCDFAYIVFMASFKYTFPAELIAPLSNIFSGAINNMLYKFKFKKDKSKENNTGNNNGSHVEEIVVEIGERNDNQKNKNADFNYQKPA